MMEIFVNFFDIESEVATKRCSHMECTAKNATYLSPDIQNSVLNAAGEVVRE